MTAQLFVRSQDLEDDMKMDPVQASFRRRALEDDPFEEELSFSNEGGLTREEVENILVQNSVPQKRSQKILAVLFSKKYACNRESKEEPIGLRLEIPEGASQFLQLVASPE